MKIDTSYDNAEDLLYFKNLEDLFCFAAKGLGYRIGIRKIRKGDTYFNFLESKWDMWANSFESEGLVLNKNNK